MCIAAGVWHSGGMFNNELVLKAIGRRVFPGMGVFSVDGRAKIDLWEACFSAGNEAAWLTVSAGSDLLFQVEVRGSRVKATYALPAVMELGNGEKEYGTAWANSRCWRVDGWSNIPAVSIGIQKFFDNIEEFCGEEEKVCKAVEESKIQKSSK